MPRNTGISMPRKRKRAVAEAQMAPDAATNEPNQDSTGGRTSPSTSELPSDEDENDLSDLLADEREEMNMLQEMTLEETRTMMQKIDAKLRLAGRLYDAKRKRLSNSAMKSAVGWLERHYQAEIAWRDANLEHWVSKEVVAEFRDEAKDQKIRFLERENARLRRMVPRT